jgi:hypothetical protein
MKRLARAVPLAVILLLALPLAAQTGAHTVTLTWTASPDGGVVTVYRATGTCSTVPLTFTAISTGVTGTTYVDSGIAPGKFCYQVTTVVNGAESLPSNQAQAVILPLAPTTLVAVPK